MKLASASRITIFVLTITLLGTFSISDAFAEVEMFLKLGDIDGSSNDSHHKNWIEVLTYSINVMMADGVPFLGDLEFEHNLDASTPMIYKALLSGEVMDEVTLELCDQTTQRQVCYMQYKLENASVSQVITSRGGTGDLQYEEVDLEYEKIHFIYNDRDQVVSYCWDKIQNRTCQ